MAQGFKGFGSRGIWWGLFLDCNSSPVSFIVGFSCSFSTLPVSIARSLGAAAATATATAESNVSPEVVLMMGIVELKALSEVGHSLFCCDQTLRSFILLERSSCAWSRIDTGSEAYRV